MAEYIERDRALQAIEGMKRPGKSLVIMYLQEIKAADVAPVRHGRWIGEEVDFHGSTAMECSCCHKVRIIDEYCPNCGAKMDEKDVMT